VYNDFNAHQAQEKEENQTHLIQQWNEYFGK